MQIHMPRNKWQSIGLVLFILMVAVIAYKIYSNIAAGKDSDGFYAAKLATARFYFARILPRAAAHASAALAGADSVMALTEDKFAF